MFWRLKNTSTKILRFSDIKKTTITSKDIDSGRMNKVNRVFKSNSNKKVQYKTDKYRELK